MTELPMIVVHSDESLAAHFNPKVHQVYLLPTGDGSAIMHFRSHEEELPPGATKVEVPEDY